MKKKRFSVEQKDGNLFYAVEIAAGVEKQEDSSISLSFSYLPHLIENTMVAGKCRASNPTLSPQALRVPSNQRPPQVQFSATNEELRGVEVSEAQLGHALGHVTRRTCSKIDNRLQISH